MRRHTYAVTRKAQRDRTVENFQLNGWEIEEESSWIVRFKRQARGPFGRFRRNQWLHLIVLTNDGRIP